MAFLRSDIFWTPGLCFPLEALETASNHFLQTVTQVMGAGRYLLKWIEVVYFHKLHVIDWKY